MTEKSRTQVLQKYLSSSFVKSDKKLLLEKVSFLEEEEYRKEMKKTIFSLLNKKDTLWKSCIGSCQKVLQHWIHLETQTTAFFLRVLYHCILGDKKNAKIKIDNPTGWIDHDIHQIKLEIKNCKNRLIFGFGPSASGKTFLINELLTILRKKQKDFPTTFLSIDGGIIRESSIVYRTITDIILQNFKVGIQNLSQPNILSSLHLETILFPQNKIKKQILQLLSKNSGNYSLYVPETLSACGSIIRSKGTGSTCKDLVQKYNKIVQDDEWIGIMIYQHKNKCSFPDAYACETCVKSGKEREMKQGKKYSSTSWLHSYNIGMKMMRTAPGYSILIHNSGNKERPSLITDFSKDAIIKNDIYKNKKLLFKYYPLK